MNNLRVTTPPQSAGSETSFSSDDPRPHFYIVRPDMTFVPLIAIDEINPMVRIHGVPPSLTTDEIEDWSMARVGDQIERPKNYYRIEFSTGGDGETNSIAQKPRLQAKSPSKDNGLDHTPQKGSHNQRTDAIQQSSAAPVQEGGAGNANSAGGIQHGSHEAEGGEKSTDQEDVQDAIDRMVRENKMAREDHPSKTKNAATPGIYGKKKFCTYWIRTGNCDYVQEGCKYLHVIPNEETRLRIGVRDMPKWAKEDIPAPQQDFFSKQHPAMDQDWRRGASRSGRVDELPETSTALTRQTRPARAAIQAPPVDYRSNDVRVHQEQFPAANVASPAFHGHASHVASQNHAGFESASNTPSTSATDTPSTSSTAESFHRQMQTQPNGQTTQPILTTPTSAAQRYSPPTQPPISRPTTNPAYRAPDKMPAQDQRPSMALGQFHTQGQTQNTNFASPWNPPSQPGSFTAFGSQNGTTSSPAKQHPNITPLSPLQTNPTSMNASGFGPSAAAFGPRRFAHRISDTPTSAGPSSMESQHQKSPHPAPVFGSQQGSPSNGAQSQFQNPFQQAPNNYAANQAANNQAAKRMFNGHLFGNVNGCAKPGNAGNAVTQSVARVSPSEGIQNNTNAPTRGSTPAVFHRRHFVGPGEPQYVAASVEAQKVEEAGKSQQGKKSGAGGGGKKKGGARGGRGSDNNSAGNSAA